MTPVLLLTSMAFASAAPAARTRLGASVRPAHALRAALHSPATPLRSRQQRSGSRAAPAWRRHAVSMGDGSPSSASSSSSSSLVEPEIRKLSYPLDVLVVGGGIGGLTLAKTLKMAGANVRVTERADIETIKLRAAGGPIQLASNALGVLRRIDPELFKRIQTECTVTGLRNNGLKDGKTGDWYLMFDTKTPAKKRELPPTAVIDRPDLQQLLIDDLGNKVTCGKTMVRYENLAGGGVDVHYSDGSKERADLVVGADGIWSQVRAQMHEEDKKTATYSGFKVFAGICEYTPHDIKEVGYKVFMGKKKYFVATDIGKGRVQWYAFIGVDANEETPEGAEALTWLHDDVFGEWTNEVREIIAATEVSAVENRALYDRPPQITKSWSDGHVALVGDAIHPMMPNLGQGGCMAIEDAFVLADELAKIDDKSRVPEALRAYRWRRQVRTAAVQGLSRFGAEMLLRFFDHPMRVEMEEGKMMPRVVNFGYLGFLMAAWKVLGVLDTTFKLQFNYLFEEP